MCGAQSKFRFFLIIKISRMKEIAHLDKLGRRGRGESTGNIIRLELKFLLELNGLRSCLGQGTEHFFPRLSHLNGAAVVGPGSPPASVIKALRMKCKICHFGSSV